MTQINTDRFRYRYTQIDIRTDRNPENPQSVLGDKRKKIYRTHLTLVIPG